MSSDQVVDRARTWPQRWCYRAPPAARSWHWGAAGSRRIISAILHVLSGVIDLGLDITDAVAAPRVHGLVGRKVWIERPAASNALLARLRARNRIPIVKSRLNFAMGSVNALQLMTDGSAKGAADPRRDGLVEVLS
ncbi:gamma-glutamyltransferase [Bradyrhizobium ottawaense]